MGSGVPVAVAAVVGTTLAMFVGAACASSRTLDSFAPLCDVAGEYKCKTEALSYLYVENYQPPVGNTTTVTTVPEWIEDIEIEKTGDATFRVGETQICAFDIASPSVADVARCVDVDRPTEYTYQFSPDCETVFVKEVQSIPEAATPEYWTPYVTGRKVCVRTSATDDAINYYREPLRRRAASPPCVDSFLEPFTMQPFLSYSGAAAYFCKGVTLEMVDGVARETSATLDNVLSLGIWITTQPYFRQSGHVHRGPSLNSTFYMLDQDLDATFVCGWDFSEDESNTAQCADVAIGRIPPAGSRFGGKRLRMHFFADCDSIVVETSQPQLELVRDDCFPHLFPFVCFSSSDG